MFMNSSKPVTAKISGSTLVVAFKESSPPLVWKFDLDRNHNFTVALQGEDNDLQLGVNSPRGEFQPIAHFTDRDAAEDAFEDLQKILMTRRQSPLRTILTWVGAAVVLFLVVIAILRIGVVMRNGGGYTNSAEPPEIKPGVAMPADQVLRPPP
jgi:hypothetical protein